MAVTYGFYNALNHDRLYDAIQMSSIFDGIIRDGIFSTIGDTMIVTAPEDGMYVNVGSGRAWFNHTWTLNDTDYPIEAEQSEVVLDRIDAVILEVNSSAEVRANSIKFLKGTPSSNPVKPTLTHNAEVNQYALAYVRIRAGQTTIFQSDIENAVGTDETPFITGVLQQVSIETLLKQWEAEFNTYFTNFKDTSTTEFNNWFAEKVSEYTAWFAQMQTDMDSNFNEFDAWFQNIKDQLDENQAGHLQLQIDALNSDINALEAEMPFAGGSKVNINFEYDVKPNIQYSNEHYKLTVGDTVRENNFSSSNLHFNEYGILTVGDGVLEVTYDITDSRTGKITHASYTYTINMPYFGRFAYNVTISASLYNYQGWLESIGKDPSQYSTIEDVFADEKLLRELMTRHVSVDYLVEWLADNNEDAHTVLNNDYCAKWINLRDYALDKLYANPTVKAVMDEVDKYGYGEWALVNAIHKMESDMGINGIASSSGADSYPAWHAFDRNDNTTFTPNVDTPRERFYLRYSFNEATKIDAAEIRATSYSTAYYYNIKIQASNDGTTWEDISNDLQIKEEGTKGTEVLKFEIIHSGYYKHYQIICSSTNAASMYVNAVAALFINDVNFYSWQPKGNVPVMTSNTAPYGETISDSTYSTNYPYNVFDNNDSTVWSQSSASVPSYIGYKFTNPIMCKRLKITIISDSTYGLTAKDYNVQASNDGNTWIDLTTGTLENSLEDVTKEINFENEGYYLYYRFYITSKYFTGSGFVVRALQFYGRQLNVSVPKMTSNTAPWGEASMHADQGSPNSSYPAWKAFDKISNLAMWNGNDKNGSGTINDNAYIRYRFANHIVPRMFGFRWGDESKPNYIFTVKVQGSNDGILWEDLSSDIEQSMTTNMKYYALSNANNEYKYIQLLYIAYNMPSNIACPQASEIQFYGLDYSEREFGEGSTMKYLYDHGVEFEEIYTQPTVTKKDNDVTIAGTSSAVARYVLKDGLNLANYKILRAKISGYTGAYGISYLIVIKISTGETTSYGGVTNDNVPNNCSLDVSSINDLESVGFQSQNGSSITFNELWLE